MKFAAGGGPDEQILQMRGHGVAKQESASVVFWIDLFLLGIAVLCAIVQLPRLVARLRSPDERRYGHRLYRSLSLGIPASSSESMKTSNSLTRLMPPTAGSVEENEPVTIPPHVPALSTRLRPLSKLLRIRFSGRIHIGGTLLLVFYLATILFAGLYRTSLFTNRLRAGYVAISQIPLVVALATKNNLISVLTGVGWDHLNYIHRFSGRLIVIAANVHAIGYVYHWTAAGMFTSHISQPRYIWGTTALLCIDVLFFFSLAIWRKRAYNMFFLSHVVAFILFLVAVCLHMPVSLSYVLAGAGIYALDVALRCAKSRICTARIHAVPELCITSVRVPFLNAGWRAGQHVRLRVLSTSMGWYGWAEAHPFTIASASKGTAQQGLVVLCKNTGRWTEKLYEMAMAGGDFEGDGGDVDVKVMVEGPYGGPGNTVISSFSAALFVVGGSGISYALASVEELIERSAKGSSSVSIVELIWCIRHPESLSPLLSILSSLILESAATPLSLQISVFFTRAETSEHMIKSFDLPQAITLGSGHPDITFRLRELVERTRTDIALQSYNDRPRGVVVGTCGPRALGEDVRAAIDGLGSDLHKAVGGIELLEEIYSL